MDSFCQESNSSKKWKTVIFLLVIIVILMIKEISKIQTDISDLSRSLNGEISKIQTEYSDLATSLNVEISKIQTEYSDLAKTLKNSFPSLAPQCINYGILNDVPRNITFEHYPWEQPDPLSKLRYFDDNLLDEKVWYRMMAPAGTKIPEKLVRKHTKYAYSFACSGWMNGTHPEAIGLEVERKVCFDNESYDKICESSTNVKVKNCGAYYVYKLPKTNRKYCAE